MSFFSPDPHHDPRLGTFVRRRGRWIGALDLAPHGRVELRVSGGRRAPAPAVSFGVRRCGTGPPPLYL